MPQLAQPRNQAPCAGIHCRNKITQPRAPDALVLNPTNIFNETPQHLFISVAHSIQARGRRPSSRNEIK
jgi:hypothetical protein